MKKAIKTLIAIVILCLIGFIYYYAALPAVNIHSSGFWCFILVALGIATAIVGFISKYDMHGKIQSGKKVNKFLFIMIGTITGAMIIVFIIGSILSSSVVNAKKYQKLLTITDRNYTDDIKENSYKDIPIIDKDSPILLGSSKMGSIAEFVFQFEVGSNYTQIN